MPFNTLIHSTYVPCCSSSLGILTKVCTALISAMPGSLLSFAPGSPEDLQAVIAGGSLVRPAWFQL